MPDARNRYVVVHEEQSPLRRRWVLKRDGAKRALRRFLTEQDAIRQAAVRFGIKDIVVLCRGDAHSACEASSSPTAGQPGSIKGMPDRASQPQRCRLPDRGVPGANLRLGPPSRGGETETDEQPEPAHRDP